jgi:predicted AlkP superfamily pyrophosphatase or phosphodiesterase
MNSICVLFALFRFVFSAPLLDKQQQRLTSTLTNPTLLISLDGFNAPSLDKFLADNPLSVFQKEFVDIGTKADYMIPSFPSLTFP